MKLNPVSVIKADLGINPGGKVEKFFTDTCARYMDKYVPFKAGALRETVIKDGIIQDGVTTNAITYKVPYAHYQYTGKVYVMENGKSAYYSEDYGYWSKPGGKKHPTDRDLTYRTTRNRSILG